MANIRSAGDSNMISERNDQLTSLRNIGVNSPIDYESRLDNNFNLFRVALTDNNVYNALFRESPTVFSPFRGNRDNISPDFGKSSLDWKYAKTIEDLMDPTDMRAQNQSGLQKLSNSILKGLGMYSTTAVSGNLISQGLGLLYATVFSFNPQAASHIHESMFGTTLDFTKYKDGKKVQMNPWQTFWSLYNTSPLNETVAKTTAAYEEFAPNYRSREELNTPWYKRMNTINFWADDILKNFGFTVGALSGGKLTGDIISKMMKSMKSKKIGELFKILGKDVSEEEFAAYISNLTNIEKGSAKYSEIEKALEQLNKIYRNKNLVSRSMSIASAALGEASIESANLYNEMLDSFSRDFDNALEKNNEIYMREYLGNINKWKKNGINTYEDFIKYKKDQYLRDCSGEAMRAANHNLFDQMIILSLSNTFGLGRQYFKTGWKLTKQLSKLKTLDSESIGRTLAKGMGSATIEALEEVAQKQASEWGKIRFGSRVSEMHTDIMNPDIISPLLLAHQKGIGDLEKRSYFDEFNESVKKSWGDMIKGGDTGVEAFAGFLFGALGIPGGIHTNASGKKSLRWNDGIIGAFQERAAKNAMAEHNRRIVEDFNQKGGLIPLIQHAAAEMQRINKMDFASRTNNEFLFKNNAYASLLAGIALEERFGNKEAIDEDIHTLRDIITKYTNAYNQWDTLNKKTNKTTEEESQQSELAAKLRLIEDDISTVFGGLDYGELEFDVKMGIIKKFSENIDRVEAQRKDYIKFFNTFDNLYGDKLSPDEIEELTKIYMMGKDNHQRANDLFRKLTAGEGDDVLFTPEYLKNFINKEFNNYKRELEGDNFNNSSVSLLDRSLRHKIRTMLLSAESTSPEDTLMSVILSSDYTVEEVTDLILDLIRNKAESEVMMKNFSNFISDREGFKSIISSKLSDYSKLLNDDSVNKLYKKITKNIDSDEVTIESIYDELKYIDDVNMLKALAIRVRNAIRANPDMMKADAAIYKRAGDIYINPIYTRIHNLGTQQIVNGGENPEWGEASRFLNNYAKMVDLELGITSTKMKYQGQILSPSEAQALETARQMGAELDDAVEGLSRDQLLFRSGDSVNSLVGTLQERIQSYESDRSNPSNKYKTKILYRILQDILLQQQLSNFISSTVVDWCNVAYTQGKLGKKLDRKLPYSSESFINYVYKTIKKKTTQSRQSSTTNPAGTEDGNNNTQQFSINKNQNANALENNQNATALWDPTKFHKVDNPGDIYMELYNFLKDTENKVVSEKYVYRYIPYFFDTENNTISEVNEQNKDSINSVTIDIGATIKDPIRVSSADSFVAAMSLAEQNVVGKITIAGEIVEVINAKININFKSGKIVLMCSSVSYPPIYINYDLYSAAEKGTFNMHFNLEREESHTIIHDMWDIFNLPNTQLSERIKEAVLNAQEVVVQGPTASPTTEQGQSPVATPTITPTTQNQSHGAVNNQPATPQATPQNVSTQPTSAAAPVPGTAQQPTSQVTVQPEQGTNQSNNITAQQPEPIPQTPAAATEPTPTVEPSPLRNPYHGTIYQDYGLELFPDELDSRHPTYATLAPISRFSFASGSNNNGITPYTPTNTIDIYIQEALKKYGVYDRIGMLPEEVNVKFKQILLKNPFAPNSTTTDLFAWGIYTSDLSDKDELVGIVSPSFKWLVKKLGDPGIYNASSDFVCTAKYEPDKENFHTFTPGSREAEKPISKLIGFDPENKPLICFVKQGQNGSDEVVSNYDLSEDYRQELLEAVKEGGIDGELMYGRLYMIPDGKKTKAFHINRPPISSFNDLQALNKDNRGFPILRQAFDKLVIEIRRAIDQADDDGLNRFMETLIQRTTGRTEKILFSNTLMDIYQTEYVYQLIKGLNDLLYVTNDHLDQTKKYRIDLKKNARGVSIGLEVWENTGSVYQNNETEFVPLIELSNPDFINNMSLTFNNFMNTLINNINAQEIVGEHTKVRINVTDDVLSGDNENFTLEDLMNSRLLESSYPATYLLDSKYNLVIPQESRGAAGEAVVASPVVAEQDPVIDRRTLPVEGTYKHTTTLNSKDVNIEFTTQYFHDDSVPLSGNNSIRLILNYHTSDILSTEYVINMLTGEIKAIPSSGAPFIIDNNEIIETLISMVKSPIGRYKDEVVNNDTPEQGLTQNDLLGFFTDPDNLQDHFLYDTQISQLFDNIESMSLADIAVCLNGISSIDETLLNSTGKEFIRENDPNDPNCAN